MQATAGITSSIGAGQALYGTDLTSPGGGWIDDGSQCYFSPQGYHVQSYSAHTAAWCYSGQQQFSKAVITVQAQLLRGDSYGLMFRLSPASDQFYVLELNAQGAYRFVLANGNNPLNWLTLIDWTHSNAIQSGYGHTNTLLVLTNGHHFRFYINKQLIVNNFSDTTYATGLIGFLVAGDSPGGTEAIFSNIWVFQNNLTPITPNIPHPRRGEGGGAGLGGPLWSPASNPQTNLALTLYLTTPRLPLQKPYRLHHPLLLLHRKSLKSLLKRRFVSPSHSLADSIRQRSNNLFCCPTLYFSIPRTLRLSNSFQHPQHQQCTVSIHAFNQRIPISLSCPDTLCGVSNLPTILL